MAIVWLSKSITFWSNVINVIMSKHNAYDRGTINIQVKTCTIFGVELCLEHAVIYTALTLIFHFGYIIFYFPMFSFLSDFNTFCNKWFSYVTKRPKEQYFFYHIYFTIVL